MRVLLDDCVPQALRRPIPYHDVVTAAYARLSGYKNGALLKAADDAGFGVLVTGDKTLQYEQNLTGRMLALVSLSANGWRTIQPHAAKIARAVDQAKPGSFTRVECGVFVRRRKTADRSAGGICSIPDQSNL